MSSLNQGQREAVNALDGPVLVLAGAGTGKTRTVTCRIAHMLEKKVQPERILAVTFTNKAAVEMKERVAGMVSKKIADRMTVCTFHSLCVRILREGIEELGYKKNFSIYTGADQMGLIKQLIVRKGGKNEKIEPKMVLSMISNQKNAGRGLDEFPDPWIGELAQAYQNELRAQNAVDFDDLLVLGERLLREHPQVRRRIQERYERVTVDEFQDTNSLQMRLLQKLVGEPYHVCVVGDDDQSIYGWRGADVTNILQFEKFFPNPQVVRLEVNYRSTKAVLHTANSLIKHNYGRREKELIPAKVGGVNLRLMTMPGDEEEAQFIADEIHEINAVEKKPFEDFAILFRTNVQSRHLEGAMREMKIPYRMVGAQSFYDRKEVRDVLSYLQVLHSPMSDVPLLRIMNTPPRGIGQGSAVLITDASRERGCSVWEAMGTDAVLEQLSTKVRGAVGRFVELVIRYHERMRRTRENLGRVFKEFLEEVGYVEWMKKGCKTENEMLKRVENVQEVYANLADACERGLSLRNFLDRAALGIDKEDDLEKQKGVCLITLHASKGLEFPQVYLVGLENGILPHKRSLEEGTTDEERRLLYVGITRAQDKLTMSYCNYRTKYGERVHCEPSEFIKELDFEYIDEVDYEEIMQREVSAAEASAMLADLMNDD